MVVDENKMRRAYNLYSWGVPITEIAVRVGVDASTIHRYKNDGNWEKLQLEDLQFASKNTPKARKLKNSMVIAGGIDLIARGIANGSIKFTMSDLPNLIKAQRLEEGETTENIGMIAQMKIDEAYKAFMEEEEKETGVKVVGTVFSVTLTEKVVLSDAVLEKKDFVRVLQDRAVIKVSLNL